MPLSRKSLESNRTNTMVVDAGRPSEPARNSSNTDGSGPSRGGADGGAAQLDDRLAAARADPEESIVQRLQVHRRGQCQGSGLARYECAAVPDSGAQAGR